MSQEIEMKLLKVEVLLLDAIKHRKSPSTQGGYLEGINYYRGLLGQEPQTLSYYTEHYAVWYAEDWPLLPRNLFPGRFFVWERRAFLGKGAPVMGCCRSPRGAIVSSLPRRYIMIKNDFAIISTAGSRTEPDEDFPGCELLGKAVIVVAELLMGKREPVP